MKHPRLRRSPHRSQAGFTLIELLVVIIILGILAAVVVFAVRGTGEKGRAAAIAADKRIVRTAVETYCAARGRYPKPAAVPAPGEPTTPMEILVQERFLSEASKHHFVEVTDGPGCGGTTYTIQCILPGCDVAPPPPTPPWVWRDAAGLTGGLDEVNAFAGARAVNLADGRVLRLNSSTSEIFDPGLESWTPTPQARPPETTPLGAVLIEGEAGPTCLHCGKVLVQLHNRTLFSDDWYLYDPVLGTWQMTSHPTSLRRYGTTFTLIKGTNCGGHCNKVLVVGSNLQVVSGDEPQLHAELYDPRTGLWTETAQALSNVYPFGPITSLLSGKVMVGGDDGAQIFDPNANGGAGGWEAVASPGPRRYRGVNSVFVLLQGGRVLAAQEANRVGDLAPLAEIYDPLTGLWTDADACVCAGANAVRLPDGKVLFAGNRFGANLEEYSPSGYIFDPETGLWTPTTPFRSAEGRRYHTLSLLPSGKVLVAGGEGPDGPLRSAEIYGPPA